MKIKSTKYTITLPEEKGVFVFGIDSATGKSHLVSAINTYLSANDGDITVIQYNRTEKEDYYLSKLETNDTVVILDDFDLYITDKIFNKLLSLNKTVLIVLKDLYMAKRKIKGFVTLKVSETEMEVKVRDNGIRRQRKSTN